MARWQTHPRRSSGQGRIVTLYDDIDATLDMSVRAENILVAAGLRLWSEVARRTGDELAGLRHSSARLVREQIVPHLEARGLALAAPVSRGRPKKPPGAPRKPRGEPTRDVTLSLTQSARDVLAAVPSGQRSGWVSRLIVEHGSHEEKEAADSGGENILRRSRENSVDTVTTAP